MTRSLTNFFLASQELTSSGSHNAHFAAGGRGGPAEASKRPQTSALVTRVEDFEAGESHLDMTKVGVHSHYANGQERPLLRGWVHFVALLLVEGLLASGSLPLQTAALLRASSVGFYGSCIFHMLSWTSMQAFQFALAVDFQAIRHVPPTSYGPMCGLALQLSPRLLVCSLIHVGSAPSDSALFSTSPTNTACR